MVGWLRRFLTDSTALEHLIAGELHAIEDRLSQRMLAIEQRRDENEQMLRRLGHQVARIEGRTSFLQPADPPSGRRPVQPT